MVVVESTLRKFGAQQTNKIISHPLTVPSQDSFAYRLFDPHYTITVSEPERYPSTMTKTTIGTAVAMMLCPAMGFMNNDHLPPPLKSWTYSSSVLFASESDMSGPGGMMSSSDIPTFPLVADDKIVSRLPTQRGKDMSESIPFLACPRVLKESDLAGNVGFDPLGLAQNREQLLEYREAEIKHARLAMLAAIGWPISELTDRSIADFFNAQPILDASDRVPSVLNGGMDRISPQFWGFCLGMSAAIDMYGVAKARRGDVDYYPGNLGFDPLGLFPVDRDGQENMKLAEIKHGRVAMIGVSGYVAEEYMTKMAVVDDTPFLFQPISETVEEALTSAVSAVM
jgi:hypothetical protein